MKYINLNKTMINSDLSVKLSVRCILRDFTLFFGLATLVFLQACDPSKMKNEDFGSLPSASEISIQATPLGDYRFLITAKAPSYGIAKWDFGNGTALSGSANYADTAYYPLPGTYKVKLALYTRAGVVYDSTTVTTTKTDYQHFNTPIFKYISGGIDSATIGKTWVMDSLHWGHVGLGDPTHTWPDWWGANALDKTGCGMYDDKLVFKLDGLHMDYINNGTTYAQNGVYTDLGGTATSFKGDDLITGYTPSSNITWNIKTQGGKNYLVLSNGGFVIFYTGAPFEYEITSIDANTMTLRQQVSWTAWYFKLIREGYTY